MNADELIPGCVYRVSPNGELAEFSRIGGTGLAIFHPPGEPDMQSCWAVKSSLVER